MRLMSIKEQIILVLCRLNCPQLMLCVYLWSRTNLTNGIFYFDDLTSTITGTVSSMIIAVVSDLTYTCS